MVGLVVLTALGVAWVTSYSLEVAVLPIEMQRLRSRAQEMANDFANTLRIYETDVLLLRAAPTMEGFARTSAAGGKDPIDGVDISVWRARAERLMLSLTQVRPDYMKVRIIAATDEGKEMARVDRLGPGEENRIVPMDELQTKGDRPFFQEARNVPPGDVLLSAIDLNQDFGKILEPHTPTIRASLAVPNPDGSIFGIVFINVDLRPTFESIRRAGQGNERFYAVNGEGDYLVHQDPSREFGFDLGTRHRLQDDAPGLPTSALANQGGVYMIGEDSDSPLCVATSSISTGMGRRFTIVATAPKSDLLVGVNHVRRASLLGGAAATIVAIAVALILARSMSQPLTTMTKAVETWGSDVPLPPPVDAAGEVGILARAFLKMGTDLKEKTAALEQQAERDRALASVIQESDDAIVSVSLAGEIVLWNAAAERLLGYTADEAIGQHIRLIVPDERASEQADIIKDVVRGRLVKPLKTVRRAKDGTRMDVMLTVSPRRAETGETMGVVGTMRAVS